MIVPFLVDLAEGRGQWMVFAQSAIITGLFGTLLAIACSNGVKEGLTIQQTFLLTTGVWLALPLFGALPFVFGATEARYVDAFFEAMSGLTTTGSTVFSGLENLPKGLLLWRGILQWLGGIGIIVVAMVFLPELGLEVCRSLRQRPSIPWGKSFRARQQFRFRSRSYTSQSLWPAHWRISLLVCLLLMPPCML